MLTIKSKAKFIGKYLLKAVVLLIIIFPIDIKWDSKESCFNDVETQGDKDLFLHCLGVYSIDNLLRLDIWENLGTAEFDSENWDEAINAYRHVASYGNLSKDSQIRLGEAYYQLNQFENASMIWQNSVKTYPDQYDTYKSLVKLHLRLSEIAEVERVINQWSEKFPDGFEPFYYKGLLTILNDNEEATLILEECVKLDDSFVGKIQVLLDGINESDKVQNEWERLTLKGVAYGKIGSWEFAEYSFRKAIEYNSAYSDAWAFLGEAQQQLGYADGYTSLTNALKNSPGSSNANGMMALYWRRRASYGLASAYLFNLTQRYPGDYHWHLEWGHTLIEAGYPAEAIQHYEKASMIKPDELIIWESIAKASLKNSVNLRTIGLPAARRANELNPNNPVLHNLMGVIMTNLNDPISAERFFFKAISMDRSLYSAYYHLGQLYLTQGKRDLAENYLRFVVAYDADDSCESVSTQILIDRYFPDRND